MNFKQSQEYLCGLKEKNVKFDLAQMQELTALLGIRAEKINAVHMTGSNGKGSTTAFVSSMLKEAGYRTGTYTSPHLASITERIKINGKNISEKEFAKHISLIAAVGKKMKEPPSYFEAITATAFAYFLEQKTDFVAAEVGLGGRLDATNVLNGLVNVFTDISLEHTNVLGPTIRHIATEKAHIIKQNSFTVISKKNAGYKTISEFAQKQNSAIVLPKFKKISSNAQEQKFDLIEPFRLKNAKIKLIGEFQLENAALAVGAVFCLQKKGYKIPTKAILRGLEKTFWPARLQIVQKNPLLVVDSTHTPKGALALKSALGLFDFKKLVLVFSVLQDKDFKKILDTIPFDDLIVTKVNYFRALSPKTIKKTFPQAIIEKNMALAVKRAKKIAEKSGLILVTGSIYGAGEAMKALKVKA